MARRHIPTCGELGLLVRARVGELLRSLKSGLQDGGRCVRAIIAKNDTRVVFVLKQKSVHVG